MKTDMHPTAPVLGVPLSLDEWYQLEEDRPGELVDGRLAEEEVPDATHELAVSWLVIQLGIWRRGRGGFVFGS